MKNKICILLLITIVVFVLAPVFVSAEYDGTNYKLEAEGYIGISTEEELKRATGKVYLKKDITFTNGIGQAENNFTLDGNGHTVFFDGGISIFGKVSGLNVQNLTLKGNVVLDKGAYGTTDPVHYGPLAIEVSGSCTYENVHSYVSITINDDSFSGSVGGIIGHSTSTSCKYKNVSYEGSINTGNSSMPSNYAVVNVGGIAGAEGYGTYITNVAAKADITVNNDNLGVVGGLFGKVTSVSQAIKNCAFSGSVKVDGAPHSVCGVGGIIGHLSNYANITNVSNEANISLGSKTSFSVAGGIIGFIESRGYEKNLSYLINTGDVIGVDVAGGIIGRIVQVKDDIKLIFNYAKNEGNIYADIAGGILGLQSSASPFSITDSYNSGRITVSDGSDKSGGGIVGYFDAKSQFLSNSVNTSYNIGELVGKNVVPLFKESGRSVCRSYNSYYSNDVEAENGIKTTVDKVLIEVSKLKFTKTDKTELSDAINKFDSLDSKKYTPESWEAASTLVRPTRQILESSSASVFDVIAAVKDVNDAIALLVDADIPQAEHKALDELIAECEAIKGDYSDNTWPRFKEALSNAKKATTLYQKEEAYKELLDAKNSLVYVGALIEALNKLPNAEKHYESEEDWQLAYNTRSHALGVLWDANLTQKMVDDETEIVIDVLKRLNIDVSDITLPSESTGITDWGNAWSEFLAMQGESSQGNTDYLPVGNGESFDFGAVIGIFAVVILAVAAIGAGIMFGRKEE